MAVQPAQFEILLPQGFAHKFLGLPGLDRDAELGVDLAGAHGIIGVRVYAGGDAQQHALTDACAARFAVQSVQLLHVIYDEAAHTRCDGIAYFTVGLAAAVEIQSIHGEAGLQRRAYFTRGHNIGTQPFLGDYLIHALEGRRLARVEHLAALPESVLKRMEVHAAIVPDAPLVHEIQRGAVFFR